MVLMNIMDGMVPGVLKALGVIMVHMNLVHLAHLGFLLADQDHLEEVGLGQEEDTATEVTVPSLQVETENTPREKVKTDFEDIVIMAEANMDVEAEKNLVRKPQLLTLKQERNLQGHVGALEVVKARDIVAEMERHQVKSHRMLN
ncbi:hypothetical protein QC760_008529 [Botrytis cinerea]